MSDYEAERARQIERNRELLASLGIQRQIPLILSSCLQPPALKRPASDTPDPQPRSHKRTKPILKAYPEPSRRSTRLVENASLVAAEHTQLPDDFDDRSLSSEARRRRNISENAPRIRQLPAPEYPEAEPKEEDVDYDPSFRAPLPTRDSAEDNSGYGKLHFADAPHFMPNVSPEEMMRLGSFGGTYWRSFYSSVLRKEQQEDYVEFPKEWYEGIDVERYLTSQDYDAEVNQHGVKASQSIEEWEKNGWIVRQDPRGWTQWYFRFYLGRRTPDDERQIRRMLNAVGPRGRFKTSLAKKIAQSGGANHWDDYEIAPILRQTLQHWGTRITKEDMLEYLGQ